MRIASPFGLVRGEAWWFSKIPPLLALAMIQILAAASSLQPHSPVWPRFSPQPSPSQHGASS